MGKEKVKALPFYFDTWFSHTDHLSDAAYTAYHRLLGFMWLHGEKQHKILKKTDVLRRATRLKPAKLERVMGEIMGEGLELLEREGNYLISKRLRREYEAAKSRIEKAKKGGRARRPSNAQAVLTSSAAEADSLSHSHSYLPKPKDPKERRDATDPPSEPTSAGFTIEALAARIEAASGDDDVWMRWHKLALAALSDYTHDVHAIVKYAEDCADPRIRRAKDLGELKAPGRFIASRLARLARERGVTIPAMPKGATP